MHTCTHIPSVTQLKAYANAQGLLQSWDSQYRGYISNDNGFVIYSILVPVILLTTAVTIVVGKIVLSKSFHKSVLEKTESKKKQPYNFLFLTAYILIAIVNCVFVGAEIIGIFIWCGKEESAHRTVLIKLLVFGFSILLAIIVAGLTNREFEMLTERPQTKYTVARVSKLCVSQRTAAGSKRFCIAQLLMILNIELFAVIITWNLIPIVLLIFVNPVKTIAGVSFVLSLFVLFPITLTLIAKSYEGSIQFHTNDSTQSCTCVNIKSNLINFWIIICILYVVFIWVTTYQRIVQRGADTGGAVMFAVAFLPPAILSAVAIGAKRLLHKVDPDSQEETKDSTDNCNRDFDTVVTDETVTTNGNTNDAAFTNTTATGNGNTNGQMQIENKDLI